MKTTSGEVIDIGGLCILVAVIGVVLAVGIIWGTYALSNWWDGRGK